MNKKEEIWKDIPNYEGYYQASNLGRIKSLDRCGIDKIGRKTSHKGILMKVRLRNDGYEDITLRKDGCGEYFTVHQLIAMTYIGHEPSGRLVVVDHINGVKHDNRASNLQIVTPRENQSTCYRANSDMFTSSFVGVSWCKIMCKWKSQIVFDKVVIALGYYNLEKDASSIYQKALSEINNGSFNPNDYKPKYTSKHTGVCYRASKSRWRAGIQFNKRQYELGSFSTEELAYQARLKAEEEVLNGSFLSNRKSKKDKSKPTP